MKRLPLSEQIAHPLHGERWLSNLFIFIYFIFSFVQPSVPPVPNYKLSMSIPEWLQAIQTYMKMLQYPS